MTQNDSATRPSILVVDDDFVTLERYRAVLETHEFTDYILCEDSRDVRDLLVRKTIGLVLLDLNMPHVRGEDLLEDIAARYPDVPVIVLTSADDVETAVSCMKIGAFDYMTKPVDPNRLINAIRHALRIRDLQRQVQLLTANETEARIEHPEAFEHIVTASSSMRKLFSYAEAVAQSPKAVLITGESGTGKELMAQALHRLSGSTGSFVPVNVSGLDDTIFSDTLFGHVRGAFTGADTERPGLIERAGDGTLFLDEIGDLDHAAQIKLLRLLQEREYYPLGADRPRKSRARILAATNADLTRRQQEGEFRKDLYYRLIGHRIDIPPLRARPEDLTALFHHFLNESATALGRDIPPVPKGLLALLSSYHFPGNVRELQAMIYDALSRSEPGTLALSYLSEYMDLRPGTTGVDSAGRDTESAPVLSYSGRFPTLRELEDYFIDEALDRAEGNQTIAARMLGVAQSTLSRRLRK
jgi:DNA-binding NtrC family response regulator